MKDQELLALKRRKLEILEKKAQEQAEIELHLPHKQYKMYKWQREFYESLNQFNIITAGNQLGKSWVMISKCIEWAVNQAKWPDLWKNSPNMFWYLYCDKKMIKKEFDCKWRLLLPSGPLKDHPQYGWRVVKEDGSYSHIEFNSGVYVYFHTYNQPDGIMAGTVYAVFADEEPPAPPESTYLSELLLRTSAVDGYFHVVFTPVKGYVYWRNVMQPANPLKEEMTGGFKRAVSYYDCKEYDDGTLSDWTDERIKEKEKMLPTQREVDLRIHGKFVITEGLIYSGFDEQRNIMEPHPINFASGHIYAGVDIGSGGGAHAAAIIFLWVNKDFTEGRVFNCWRGDNQETTAEDVFNKYKELCGNLFVTAKYFDYSAVDFGIYSERMGDAFIKADKTRDKGIYILNTLFKAGALKIMRTTEAYKIINEVTGYTYSTKKQTAMVDDLLDALRYVTIAVPWAFDKISFPDKIEIVKKPKKTLNRFPDDWQTSLDMYYDNNLESEIEDFNEECGC